MPLERYLEKGELPPNSTLKPSADGKPTVRGLFRHGAYMELYSLVYRLCTEKTATQNLTGNLYEAHYQRILEYSEKYMVPALESAESMSTPSMSEPFLREFERRYEMFKIYSHWMERIFTYIDRHFVKAVGKPPLRERAKEAFRTVILERFGKTLRGYLIHRLNAARDDPNNSDLDIIAGLVKVFLEMSESQSVGLYVHEFEDSLLPCTREYYQQKSEGWIASTDLPGYLVNAENALKLETDICTRCFPDITAQKLLAVVQIATLSDRTSQILEMEHNLYYLVEHDEHEPLKRAFRLFGLLDRGFIPLAQAVKDYVSVRGNQTVDQFCDNIKNSKSNPSERQVLAASVINSILELHNNFFALITTCFERHATFQKALKEGFEVFMNRDIGNYPMPLLLSNYCDQLLRQRLPLPPGVSLEALFDQLVCLFEHLLDKDYFIEIYRNQLARRILSDTTPINYERLMLGRFRLACGSSYTSRMEGMLGDLTAADQVQQEFGRYLKNRKQQLPINFMPRVLTCGHWPTYQTPELTLPPELAICVDTFSEWYLKIKTDHRKITWIHHLGSCVVTGKYENNRIYQYSCNTYQAALLLQFNEKEDNVTLDELCEKTGIAASLAKKLLTCLQVAKIIKKSKTEDSYSVNTEIVLKQKLLKVPVPAQEEVQAKEKTEEDRSVAIDAAIVRCMKQKKTLPHALLVAEVIEMLPMFKPTPKKIKQKIEDLIEREYIQRDPNDESTYVYVA